MRGPVAMAVAILAVTPLDYVGCLSLRGAGTVYCGIWLSRQVAG
jgi:hypothetical protein